MKLRRFHQIDRDNPRAAASGAAGGGDVDSVHPFHRQHQRAVVRHRPAGQAGRRAAGDDRQVVFGGERDDHDHVLLRLGKDQCCRTADLLGGIVAVLLVTVEVGDDRVGPFQAGGQSVEGN